MFIVQRPCPNCGTDIQVPTRASAEIQCPQCGTRLQQKHRSVQLGLTIFWIMISVGFLKVYGDQFSLPLVVLIMTGWVLLFAVVFRRIVGWKPADTL